MLRLRPVAAAAGDWLIKTGEIGHEMFIVDSGTIEIVSPNGSRVYRTLTAGDFFGEIALLTKARRTASCRAATFCEMWVLSRKDLHEVRTHSLHLVVCQSSIPHNQLANGPGGAAAT